MKTKTTLTGKRVAHDKYGKGICIYDSQTEKCIVRFDKGMDADQDVYELNRDTLRELPTVMQAS